jgi:hypothetical protein
MKNNTINTQLENPLRKRKYQSNPLQDKLEILRISLGDTQRYELLTTNRYLKHMKLVLDILDNLTINET